MKRLLIWTYNLKTEITPKKREFLAGQKKLLSDSGADIIVLQEVRGHEALAALTQKNYHSTFIPGITDRHIAFLIKKDLPFYVSLESHLSLKWLDPTNNNERILFTRDLPILVFRKNSRAEPSLILAGVHIKSRRDRPDDRDSNLLREAQIKSAAHIIAEYQLRYPKAAFILAGDFNGDVGSAPEFEPIRLALNDPFKILGIKGDDRVTHVSFSMEGEIFKSQSDNLFVSSNLGAHVAGARVIRQKGEDGLPKPLPQTFEEREKNWSDHDAVELDLQNLLRFWGY